MKYRIQYNRGYWVARDNKGRLVALASQCERLIKKLEQWTARDSAEQSQTTNQQ